jgi:uncharacterized protein YjbI with pentapeptide repeats
MFDCFSTHRPQPKKGNRKMKNYTPEKLKAIIEKHGQWLRFGPGGERANLTEANLTYANLTGADLTGANLTGANLAGADLTHADLTHAVLTGANLTRANLAGVDLTHANLTGANLTEADLTHANLTYADLTHADLAGADLAGADLTRAVLTGANLTEADLTGANLTHANLTGANLTEADLTHANLTYADLTAIKSDFICAVMPMFCELLFLRLAIVAGEIDGSTYIGDCACLAGTFAHACGLDFSDFKSSQRMSIDQQSPRERWFLAIRPGDTPEKSQVAAITLAWIDEAMALVAKIKAQ